MCCEVSDIPRLLVVVLRGRVVAGGDGRRLLHCDSVKVGRLLVVVVVVVLVLVGGCDVCVWSWISVNVLMMSDLFPFCVRCDEMASLIYTSEHQVPQHHEESSLGLGVLQT